MVLGSVDARVGPWSFFAICIHKLFRNLPVSFKPLAKAVSGAGGAGVGSVGRGELVARTGLLDGSGAPVGFEISFGGLVGGEVGDEV